MMFQVIEQHGDRERVIGTDLTAAEARRLRGLLTALQTDRDPRQYIIRQHTGF